jgi:TetR/AcrR family transcriptional regulator
MGVPIYILVETNRIESEGAAPQQRPGIAERLWAAARIEFSQRGYHGARVQGIARRAGCNVALLYRHWSSKRALYLDILRTVWQAQAREIAALLEQGGEGGPLVVSAYLDASLRDPIGCQVIIREILDGAPHLSQLIEVEPALTMAMRFAAEKLHAGAQGSGVGEGAVRPGLDPTMVVLTVAGIASLVASAHEVARIFTGEAITPEKWRDHLHDLLVNGIVPCPER